MISVQPVHAGSVKSDKSERLDTNPDNPFIRWIRVQTMFVKSLLINNPCRCLTHCLNP